MIILQLIENTHLSIPIKNKNFRILNNAKYGKKVERWKIFTRLSEFSGGKMAINIYFFIFV